MACHPSIKSNGWQPHVNFQTITFEENTTDTNASTTFVPMLLVTILIGILVGFIIYKKRDEVRNAISGIELQNIR